NSPATTRNISSSRSCLCHTNSPWKRTSFTIWPFSSPTTFGFHISWNRENVSAISTRRRLIEGSRQWIVACVRRGRGGSRCGTPMEPPGRAPAASDGERLTRPHTGRTVPRMRFPDLLATKWGRMAAFFLLYVTEGIPLGFTATAVATQMRRQGLGPAMIGAFVGSLYAPWGLKWVAGPIVDTLTVPRLGR